jgi:hypothetical protein
MGALPPLSPSFIGCGSKGLGYIIEVMRLLIVVGNQKHLPRYLAEFCFKFNRRFNLGNMLEQLIVSSIRIAPMPQRLLKLAEIRW